MAKSKHTKTEIEHAARSIAVRGRTPTYRSLKIELFLSYGIDVSNRKAKKLFERYCV